MHRWSEEAGRADTPAFALADSDDNSVWGVCADVSGLFVDPPVRSYQLLACAPAGPLREALYESGKAPYEPRPLGDLWLRPVGDERCPEDSERLDAWQLEDVRVIGHRPHPADPSLTDVFIEGADGYPDPPDDPYLAAGLLLRLWFDRVRERGCDLSVPAAPLRRKRRCAARLPRRRVTRGALMCLVLLGVPPIR